MSGELSSWTVDTLHMHMQHQLDDMRIMLDERHIAQVKAVTAAFEAQQTAMKVAFASSEKAIRAAMESAKEAVKKSEDSANKRFDSVNEFREQLTFQATTFMPRAESELSASRNSERIQHLVEDASKVITRDEMAAAVLRNNERFQELADRVNRNEGRGAGLSAGWIYLLGAVAAVGTIVSLYTALKH